MNPQPQAVGAQARSSPVGLPALVAGVLVLALTGAPRSALMVASAPSKAPRPNAWEPQRNWSGPDSPRIWTVSTSAWANC